MVLQKFLLKTLRTMLYLGDKKKTEKQNLRLCGFGGGRKEGKPQTKGKNF